MFASRRLFGWLLGWLPSRRGEDRLARRLRELRGSRDDDCPAAG